MDLQIKPQCAACNLSVEDHFGEIDSDVTYFCSRPACKDSREELSKSIESVFEDYESDFADDERRTEAAEAEVNLIAAKKAARAQRGLTILKGSALYRKLRREWPEAAEEAILSVTIERARKSKPPTWAELICDKKHRAQKTPVRNSELRFESHVNDPRFSLGVAPEGTNHIPGAEGSISRITQDMASSEENVGFSIIDTGSINRTDRPEWIISEKSIVEFLDARDLKAAQISNDYVIRSWEIGRELDRLILSDYYFGRLSDKQIFAEYKNLFELERYGKIDRADIQKLRNGNSLSGLVSELKDAPKVRWTSSPDGVKHRRLRLLRERAALFGAKVWTENSWRGIIVKHAMRNTDGQWFETTGGIATKRKGKALIVAEDSGYTGRWEGDLAELVEEKIFNNWDELVLWMGDHGLALREENIKTACNRADSGLK
jgi:hypothetical protein